MSEQPGNVGAQGGAMPPHSLTPSFPHPQQAMGGMDVMSMSQMAMGAQRLSALDGSGNSMDGLAPIFPPQNFDVPDISFSNSVSPNADFNQTLLSSAQMLGASEALYTNVGTASELMMGGQQGGQGHQMGMGGQQMTYFPPSSNSPPGTSSSEDSDDLPLAQLAKRAGPGAVAPTSTAGGLGTAGGGTDSLENSPTGGTKKGKASKRKKKKDPNEPQKPVSAYALFFRDTQATIKGHNPSASFGEVSKIVASMWDQLDPEHKDVYKKKTEMAKKQYLKQLAAYRASQVSQSAAEEVEKSPSPPGMTVAPPVMGNNSVGVMPVTTNLHQMGAGSGPVMTSSHIPVTMGGQMMGQQRPQQLQQQQPQMMQMSPQMMQQQQQMQQMHHQQQMQMSMGQQASPSPPTQQQQHSPPQQHQQQQQQSSPPAPAYSSPPHVAQTAPNNYQPNMVDHMYGYPDPALEMEATYPHCVRNGCSNHAMENSAWDSEYCSNDCVITHCRDIFTNWVAARSGSNTFPVK